MPGTSLPPNDRPFIVPPSTDNWYTSVALTPSTFVGTVVKYGIWVTGAFVNILVARGQTAKTEHRTANITPRFLFGLQNTPMVLVGLQLVPLVANRLVVSSSTATKNIRCRICVQNECKDDNLPDSLLSITLCISWINECAVRSLWVSMKDVNLFVTSTSLSRDCFQTLSATLIYLLCQTNKSIQRSDSMQETSRSSLFFR